MSDTLKEDMQGVDLCSALAQRGELSSTDALQLVSCVAVLVRDLHRQGRLHGAISTRSVLLQPSSQEPSLLPPKPVCWFGGEFSDQNYCPLELRQADALELPSDLDAAVRAMANAGVPLAPRQIDIYQLGVLLCRLITGKLVAAYLSSPRTKAAVPPEIQTLIDRALGYDPNTRFTHIDEFLDAIEQSCQHLGVRPASDLRPAELPGEVQSQAKGGSQDDTSPSVAVVDSQPDTDIDPPHGVPRPLENDLPFVTLGHYQILGRIGRGGMGDVYKGHEAALNRTVAIKVLPRQFARQEEFVRRFRAEAAAAAGITHPNVVGIHFIGEDQGHHFFAMQFVDGESLRDRLRRCGRLDPEEVMAILRQTLSGLAAAHRRGIVHRDVKPGNILLDRGTGRALLADFGLVKSLESGASMTTTGAVMGTADYISPEQGRGRDVDARSDLYSIGVLAYHMLNGSLPFQADSPTAMIFQHVYEPPPPLAEAVPDVADSLCRLVHKLLEKSPDDRHQNAEEVLADLGALRTGQLPSSASRAANNASAVAPAARPRTMIIQAPSRAETPLLPIELDQESPMAWWQRARHRLLALANRRTPDLVRRLQNTQQQVDGAVAEYERRRDDLQQLVSEAEDVLLELKRQKEDYRQAAAAAERKADCADDGDVQEVLHEQAACQQSADELAEQIAEQEKQLETMHLRLAKVNATLHTVRSQRDVLNARLKVAQAQTGLGSDTPKRFAFGPLFLIATTLVAVALVAFSLVRFWPARATAPATTTASAPPSAGAASVEPNPTESEGEPGELGDWGDRVEQPADNPPVVDYLLKEHPEGAVRFGDHWYKAVLGRMLWITAQKKCEEMGGYLACATSRAENAFVSRLHPQGHLWLGGLRSRDGWGWINGEKMSFMNWASGEPNDAGHGESFLKSDEYGLWFDVAADDGNIQGFVCEWEK